jgi:hypothetical protein
MREKSQRHEGITHQSLETIVEIENQQQEILFEYMAGFPGISFLANPDKPGEYSMERSVSHSHLGKFAQRTGMKLLDLHKNAIFTIEGLPGTGKTTVSAALEKFFRLEVIRRQMYAYVEESYLEDGQIPVRPLRVECLQMDDTERKLMYLSLPELASESGEIALQVWDSLSAEDKIFVEEHTDWLTEHYFLITSIIETGKWRNIEVSESYLDELRSMLQTSRDFILHPFELGQPYPDNFMKMTASLMRFVGTKLLKDYENKEEQLVLIVDKVGGTGGYDHNHYYETRSYGSGLAAQLRKREGAFELLDQNKVEVFGVGVTSLFPYVLTSLRMALKISRSLEEAQRFLGAYGIYAPIDKEAWEIMQTGAMFTHVAGAEKLGNIYMLYVTHQGLGLRDKLHLTPWLRKGINRNFNLMEDVFDNSTRIFPLDLTINAYLAYGLRRNPHTNEAYALRNQVANMCVRYGALALLQKTFEVDAQLPQENYILINNSPEWLQKHVTLNIPLFNSLFDILYSIADIETLTSDEIHEKVMDWLGLAEKRMIRSKDRVN